MNKQKCIPKKPLNEMGFGGEIYSGLSLSTVIRTKTSYSTSEVSQEDETDITLQRNVFCIFMDAAYQGKQFSVLRTMLCETCLPKKFPWESKKKLCPKGERRKVIQSMFSILLNRNLGIIFNYSIFIWVICAFLINYYDVFLKLFVDKGNV